jgi:hypothetical protein
MCAFTSASGKHPEPTFFGLSSSRTGREAEDMDNYHITAHEDGLTVEQADKLILDHAQQIGERAAIEDADVDNNEVRYFFESGAIGKVNRMTGAVEIKEIE